MIRKKVMDPCFPSLSEVLCAEVSVSEFKIEETEKGMAVFVVPSEDGWSTASQKFLTESWQIIFDSTYEDAQGASDSRDGEISGWYDSFTALPLSRSAMDEWSAASVERIAKLCGRRVVEIGAGTGMVLHGLLAGMPSIASYLATDVSAEALPLLRSVVERAGASDRVQIVQAEARDAGRLDNPRDLTILNSVTQYLPSTVYLDNVIRDVVDRTPEGGHVFVGDVRDADLLPLFACLKVGLRSDCRELGELQEMVVNEIREDDELSISPRFFADAVARHSRVTAVEIAPRHGREMNEMNLFRYDVVLHVGCVDNWADSESGSDRRPNRRLAHAFSVAKGLGHGSSFDIDTAIDPQDVWDAASQVGDDVRIGVPVGGAIGDLIVERGVVSPAPHCRIAIPFHAGCQAPSSSGPVHAPLVDARRRADLLDAIRRAKPNFDQNIDIRFVLSLDEKEVSVDELASDATQSMLSEWGNLSKGCSPSRDACP